MSGIIADNLERSSGLVKAASVGPTTSSSDPTNTTNTNAVGDRIINTTSGEVFVATDVTTDENTWEGQLGTSVTFSKYFGDRGICLGGTNPSNSNVIDYVTISSAGNASDFGNAVDSRRACTNQASSGTRGIFGSGGSNVMQYVTCATTGNATDFGDLTRSVSGAGAVSNGTRGIWIAGNEADDVIEYVTIATTGNGTDFGDNLHQVTDNGTCNNDTRGVSGGGYDGSGGRDYTYITMATTGNAADFGDMHVISWSGLAAVSDKTKGVWGGGISPSYEDRMEYINIASLGDASDFGNLTDGRSAFTSYGNGTRACWVAGYDGSSLSNIIDYVTIASLGNASDFGDVTEARQRPGGLSGDAS